MREKVEKKLENTVEILEEELIDVFGTPLIDIEKSEEEEQVNEGESKA